MTCTTHVITLILLFLIVNRKVNDISGSEVTVMCGFSTSHKHDCFGEVVQVLNQIDQAVYFICNCICLEGMAGTSC